MLPMVAGADTIYEPDNDDFYTRNRSRCEQLFRDFYANSEDGQVSLRLEPGSEQIVCNIENGQILNIMFTYDNNGEIWGVTELSINPTEERLTGWIPMAELLVVYDYISFAEDYGHEFYGYEFDGYTLFGDDIIYWAWPGSGVIRLIFEVQYQSDDFSPGLMMVRTAYTDYEGREWGFLGYSLGIRNVWICLSDPSNPDIPAFNPAPEPVLWPAVTPPPTTQSNNAGDQHIIADPPAVKPDSTQDTQNAQSNLSLPTLAIVLVIVVSAGTVILIRVLWKKNDRSEKGPL